MQGQEQVLRKLDGQQEDVLDRGDEDKVEQLEGPSRDLAAHNRPSIVLFFRIEESTANRVSGQTGAPEQLKDEYKNLFVNSRIQDPASI